MSGNYKMDIKTTRAEASRLYNIIVRDSTDLHLIQDLTMDHNNYYACGVYGWNWSAAFFGEFAFFDAYRGTPAGSKNIRNFKHVVKLFDKTIKTLESKSWRERDAYINRIRGTFYNKLLVAMRKDLEEAE